MVGNRNYTGVDGFRLVAAFLIVAIHTSPLASYNLTADFILTRITARIAVPFFFLTSGFFLISRYSCHPERLAAFEKKTALIYGIAILTYLPVNLYSGYFKAENLLPNILKDLVFDGTFYHLWYLPASMMGAAVAHYFVRTLKYPKALLLTSALYLVGLFGDSYYGIAQKVSWVDGTLDLIFQVTDYTRNGIFFAPVFFVLGGMAAEHTLRLSLGKSACALCGSFALMFVEAMTLRYAHMQRHDSMYVFLLPSVYFLFQVLLHFEGERLGGIRTFSLIVYLVHPMMIVAVRLLAKLLHLQELLIENSGIHFLAVCLASAAFGLTLAMLWKLRLESGRRKESGSVDRACLEIDLGNLTNNVAVLKSVLPPGCGLMVVVKAEAYGHGMCGIAAHLDRIGVKAFAVATVDEGIRLRRCGVSGEILILGYTAPERAKELRRYDLIQTLIDHGHAVLLNQQGCRVKTHIKIDTGMHRLGFDKEDIDGIADVFLMKHLKVCGIYTHLCAASSMCESDRCFTGMQIGGFYELLEQLKQRGLFIPKVHVQSSYGLLNYTELSCDYARVGIALYGVQSSLNDITKRNLDLRPVLSLKTKIILMRTVQQGDSVGYDRAFVADKDSVIAILPVGYADGYPRELSCGKGYVLINGHKAPTVGRICMDQMAVDVTDIPGVRVGMTATLIGRDGEEEITAPTLAGSAGSISNELLSRLGRRWEIVYR